MGLLADAERSIDARQPHAEGDDPPSQGAGRARLSTRASTVQIGGDTVTLDPPATTQPLGGEGTWLTAPKTEYGIPRGADAIEHRQIVQTSAMQSIVNGIVDQLLGGELAFQADEEVMEALGDGAQDAVDRLRRLLRDVLTGPHLGDEDLDDLITAAVEDMCGPGNAYWQLLSPTDADLPVAALTTLDPLTIRHNVDEHGVPADPPYWQASNPIAGGSLAQASAADPVPLQNDDLAVMRYPKGNRSYRHYPISPAWQVKEWLEILANSTTHHNRFYSDNEIPPGVIQIINASDTTVKNVKDKIQEASGDPRDVPIIGGEGGAQWLDMGGTAVNLNVIEEQRWFYFLCLGALGLGKAEVGMIEDVNRSNGEIESTRVFKRVAGPFGNQFAEAFLHVCRRFDAFRELGEPFTPTLTHTDPREERAREQRLREMYQAGGLTLREYVRRRGDEDLATDEDRYTVEVGGEMIDYGAHPRWVAQRLLDRHIADAEPGTPTDGDEDEEDAPTLGLGEHEATPQHNGAQ